MWIKIDAPCSLFHCVPPLPLLSSSFVSFMPAPTPLLNPPQQHQHSFLSPLQPLWLLPHCICNLCCRRTEPITSIATTPRPLSMEHHDPLPTRSRHTCNNITGESCGCRSYKKTISSRGVHDPARPGPITCPDLKVIGSDSGLEFWPSAFFELGSGHTSGWSDLARS